MKLSPQTLWQYLNLNLGPASEVKPDISLLIFIMLAPVDWASWPSAPLMNKIIYGEEFGVPIDPEEWYRYAYEELYQWRAIVDL